MKIKLTVSYDGTLYCGWQKQKNGISVQEVVENAIKDLTGEKVSVAGSGRTDAGVHAAGQVACFDTLSNIPPEKFYKALNVFLPPDIKAIKSECAAGDFHPVKAAKRKTYEYTLYESDVSLPLLERYAVRIDKGLNLNAVRAAVEIIEGTHDFKSFSATGGNVKTTVRTVYSINVVKNENVIKISVCGNGFLYNMVRIIVGTLVKVGQGKMTAQDVSLMLETGSRKKGGTTFPAKGLCLKKVEYKKSLSDN